MKLNLKDIRAFFIRNNFLKGTHYNADSCDHVPYIAKQTFLRSCFCYKTILFLKALKLPERDYSGSITMKHQMPI